MSEKLFAEALRRAVAGRQEWTDQANCHGLWEVFDMDYTGSEDNSFVNLLPVMRKICNDCPVKQQCLEDSMLFSDAYGFRAGMTSRERARLRTQTRSADPIMATTWDNKQHILRHN